jgi:carboxy-terminal domain RNA polymerase II polypeptide A small phosphatase
MKKSEQKIIVFDLDETLIHSTKTKLDLQEDFRFDEYYVYKRPFVDWFLAECVQHCAIAIWSSADDEYVQAVGKQLLKQIPTVFIWGRSECWMKIVKTEDEETGLKKKEYQLIKPLEKIRRKGFKMENLLIIDDSHYKVNDNLNNFHIIKPFTGEQDDRELVNLLEWLRREK